MSIPSYTTAVIFSTLLGLTSIGLADKVSYNFDVRPILADKCFACHGPDAKNNESGTRLDTAEGAYAKLKDAKGHAIVPGNIKSSLAWQRINSNDPEMIMPPTTSPVKPLNDKEKKIIRQWIEQGAQYENHWAFTSIKAGITPPKITGLKSTNPIDHFVSRKLEKLGWKISDQADKATLLRRVCYDLTGLPPTPKIASAYLTDNSPAAYEKLVDALLASPRYGEHLAVKWLEAARYADTTGYQHDWAWQQYPWRTWVIRAYNRNLPYNHFITWQLAGDMLPNATQDQTIATAFNRLHRLNTESGALPEEFQVENTIDRVETVSTALMGLTMGCARCHDHKYDPISQKEFYGFYAFFNSTADHPSPPGMSKAIIAPPHLKLTTQALGEPPRSATLLVSKELPKPRPTYLLNRGDYTQPNQEIGIIPPGLPKALLPFDKYAKNRLGLAQWLTTRDNPLTSRVLVNRFWQQFFGTGIVATAEDFGLQGSVPSHPELLDWLSSHWMDQNWDTKKLLRLIVTSNTYRQSALKKQETHERDPKNTLLSYFPRKRLSGYAVRDQALALSGLIRHHIGGRPVNPYQPSGMWFEVSTNDLGVRKSPFGTAVYRQDKGAHLYRRSIYTFWKRASAPPTLSIFDAPNREICTVRHDTTNTPLQALALLNDVTYLESARMMAAEVLQEPDVRKRLPNLARRILQRDLNVEETSLMNLTLEQQSSYYKAHPEDATKLLKQGQAPNPEGLDPVQQVAWMQVVMIFLNLDETITKP